MIRNVLQIAALTLTMMLGTAYTTTSAFGGPDRTSSTTSHTSKDTSKTKDASKGSYTKGKDKGTSTTKAIVRKHDVRVVKYHTIGRDGQGTYFLTIDGDLFKLVLDGDEDGVIIELFDRSRQLIVGYTVDDSRVMVLDPKGIVQDSREEHTDLSAMGSYGAAAQLLTDPGFIQDMLRSTGVDIGDDDDPSAYWVLVAYLIVRCVDVTISGDFEGNVEWSVTIDC